MKIAHNKIEVLTSNHIDNHQERTPKVKKWQLSLAKVGFQTFGKIFPKWSAKKAYDIFATPRWRATHARKDDIILSASTSDFVFDSHIIKLYEWGNPQHPAVLLAHGWESRGTALRMFVKPLVSMGYFVIAFDALGHGNSGGKQNNVATNGRTIAAIIRHYHGVYAAIGHSFGCSSLIYALQYADTNLSIDKLVFLAVPYKTRHIIESYFDVIKAPDSVKKSFYAIIEKKSGRSVDDFDVSKANKQVKVGSLLLVHDRFDDVTGIDAAETIVHNWDNARLLVTEGYGHFRLAKNPDVSKRIVDFIGC